MNTRTKILVIHSKELIYTAIITFLIIFIIIFLVILLGKKPSKETASIINNSNISDNSNYIPGVYTSDFTIGNASLSVSVSVDADRICDVEIANSNEYIETMYPLLGTTMESLSTQICANNGTQDIKIEENNQYTATLIINAVNDALSHAYNNQF